MSHAAGDLLTSCAYAAQAGCSHRRRAYHQRHMSASNWLCRRPQRRPNHHRRPAGVGMKRGLRRREAMGHPVAAPRQNPNPEPTSPGASPPRPGRHRHPRQHFPAADLQVRFQRGEADLVVDLGDDLRRHIQAAGFAVRSTGGQHDWPPTAAATSAGRPGLPPTPTATSLARTATRRRRPRRCRGRLPRGRC